MNTHTAPPTPIYDALARERGLTPAGPPTPRPRGMFEPAIPPTLTPAPAAPACARPDDTAEFPRTPAAPMPPASR
ncbi:hypothetical protein GCM10017673_38600 [Streptosporangium violaceochromogenes]|nr:hypothetical protein GCM10017673_38600 [Streptosporangium violaceochromogenes]